MIQKAFLIDLNRDIKFYVNFLFIDERTLMRKNHHNFLGTIKLVICLKIVLL